MKNSKLCAFVYFSARLERFCICVALGRKNFGDPCRIQLRLIRRRRRAHPNLTKTAPHRYRPESYASFGPRGELLKTFFFVFFFLYFPLRNSVMDSEQSEEAMGCILSGCVHDWYQ